MHKKITLIYFLLISCIIISCSKNEEPDTTPPTVSFNIAGITQNPASSTPPIVSNSIEVVINAQDAKGINKVEAFIDNTKVGEDNSAPFKIVIDLSSYNSKNSTLVKKTDKIYTLKVTATDKAGNQASTEEEILIDNEAPSITEVSLEENQVISGDENSITFKATDNQELNTTEAFINDDLVEVTLEDDIYTLNIETTSLNDGENILKITATDKLDNISNHSTTFIVDNTGPEITLANISDGDIVDSLINISPNVSDEYSDIAYIKLLLNETVIDSVAGTENISFVLDPESYSVGNHTIEIVSEDVFKNQSKLNINFEILRVLVRLNIPEDFLSSYDHSFIVFASDNEGELLATKSLTLNDREITLHAPGEFDKSTSFMLTFAANELFSQNSFSRLVTITDINRDSPEAITLKVPLRKTVKTSNIYQTEGFTNADFIHGDGLEYTSSFYHEDLTILIENYAVNSLNNTSNEVYLFSTSLNSQYSYYKTTTPLPEGFILKTSDFINDSYVNTTDFGITTSNQFILNTQLSIKGYNNDDEYNANQYHLLFRDQPELIFGARYQYHTNTNFLRYRHSLTIDNYYTERNGDVEDNYTVPDWTTNNSISNNVITINNSGADHSLGRILCMPESGTDYYWSILYDSQNKNSITLPKLPEELNAYSVYDIAQSNNIEITQSEITSLSSISNYQNFIERVIKVNEFPYLVADKIETIFNSTSGTRNPSKDLFFK